MSDKMEPVAWQWRDGNNNLVYGQEVSIWDATPLYTADQVKELTERLERAADAEAICDSYADENQRLHDRATTAEAALADARKVIGKQQAALKPMADTVYNDNGDMTVSNFGVVTTDECIAAYWADRAARQWLSANPEVKG